MQFWLRSVRRRPTAATLLAALSLLTVLASALAPLLERAVEQETLASALSRAGIAGTSVAAASQITPGESSTSQGAVTTATAVLADSGLWQRPIVVAETDGRADWTRSSSGTSHSSADSDSSVRGSAPVAGIVGPCRGMRITSGRCPDAAGEVLAATGTGLRTGDGIAAGVYGPDSPLPQRFRATVVGTYDAGAGAGRVVGATGRLFGAGGDARPDLVMALQGFDALHFSGTMWSVRTLRDGVGVDDLAEVRNGLRAAEEAGLTAESADAAVTVVQHLGTVLDALDRQHAAAALVVTVTGVQSLVLAWCTQAVLVARIGRARSAEWALARLRGLTLRRRLTTVLAEPVAAALVGSAVGLALAVPVAAGIARLLLDEAVPLEPRRAPVLVAAAAAVAGSLVALVVASIRPARLPLVDLLRRTSEPRTLSRTGAVVQAVGIVAASVVIAGIVTEQRITGPGVALLAPTLVAVLFSVVALRIAVPLVRVSAGRRRSRGTGAAGLLVVRRLARTPSALTTAVVVTIGVALAVSSAQTAAYAVRVQDDRAAADLGASTVLDVHVRSGVSFIDAVRHAAQADPGGTSRSVGPAAVAVESYTEGNGVGRLVAVDTPGLARFWNADWGGRTASDVRRMLRPTTGPTLQMTGDHLTITLGDVGDADGARIAADPSDTELFAVVANDRGWHRVVFGTPRDGTLTTDAPCEAGCRVVMLGIDSTEPSGAPFALGATVLDLAGTTSDGDTDRVTRAWLAPERWRDRIGDASTPRERPSGAVGERSDGLRVNWVDPTGTGRPAIATRDVPEPLPALVGAATDAEPFPGIAHATAGIGLDGSVQLLRVSGRAPSLPRVLDDGALVDLELANRATDPAAAVADHEVWLAPGAHPRVLRALDDAGVTVTGTRTLAAAEHHAEQGAPTLGARIGLAAAVAALLLVGIVVLGAGLVGTTAARRDVDVLRTTGFSGRRIGRLLLAETFGPAAMAVALGSVAGTTATLLVARRLPLRDGVAPPVGAPVGPWTVLVVAATALVIVFVAAAVTTRLTVGGNRDDANRATGSTGSTDARGARDLRDLGEEGR